MAVPHPRQRNCVHFTPVTLVIGEAVMLVTDGIAEVRSQDGTSRGSHGCAYVLPVRPVLPETLAWPTLAEVDRYRGKTPLPDDTCLVCFQRQK